MKTALFGKYAACAALSTEGMTKLNNLSTVLHLKEGAALAPMAGATDAAMRALCAQFGAVYTVSEMVSAKALSLGDRKSAQLLAGGGGGVPFGIQLFGADPDAMAAAAEIVARQRDKLGFAFIDINMGCPAPKITGPGAGSALLKNPVLAGRVARAVVEHAGGSPVSVKMRVGWDADDMAAGSAVELALRCEDAGVQMLTVHGRTRREMYQPGIHPQAIARVKAAVSIPVVANGDITSAEDAAALLRQTGCDGVAVGRGAMGNPWLFSQIRAAMAGQPLPPPPSLSRRLSVMREHIQAMCEEKGEAVAMRQARTHAAWYMHGLRGAAALRNACSSLEHFTDVDRLIELIWALQRPD